MNANYSQTSQICLLAALSMGFGGFKMNSDLEKNFSKIAMNPIAFNRDYGLKPNRIENIRLTDKQFESLKFESWKFYGVNFDRSGLKKSSFKNVLFEKCAFNFANVIMCEFRDCKFINCIFVASKIDSCNFKGGLISLNKSEASMGFKSQFEKNIFLDVIFNANEFSELSFEGSQFDAVLFEENDLTDAYMGRCKFLKPVLRGNKLEGTKFTSSNFSESLFQLNSHLGDFLNTEFNLAKFELKANQNEGAEDFDGATLVNSKVELKHLTGSFGVSAGSHSIFENFQ